MTRPTPVIDGSGVASIARNLTYVLGGQGVNFVMRFIYAIVLARVFGPQVYGLINYGMAWYLIFMPLTRMGQDVILSRDVGQNRQDGDRTASTTLTLRIVSIGMTATAYLVLSWFTEVDPASRLMVFVFAFALVGRSLVVWTENIYVAYEVNQYSFKQQTIFRPLEVIVGIAAVLIWRNALVVVVIHGLIWCFAAIYGLTVIRSRVVPLRLDRNYQELRRIFVQSLPLSAAMLLMVMLYQGPMIFFRHLGPAGRSLGQLALAMQVFSMLSNIPIALNSVTLPVLSRAAAREDGKERLFAETVLRYALLFGTILALLGTVLGPWLTVKFFGKRYAEAGMLVGPVLWLMIPWASGHAMLRVMMARRHDLQALYCALIGAVFFLSLPFLTRLSGYGALGAIWSTGMGMSLTMLLFVYYLRAHLAMDLRVSLIKPGLTALSGVGVFYALYSIGPVWALLGALVVLFFGFFRFGCLTPQDIVWFGKSFKWVAKKVSFAK